jgi:uncharacterized protein YbbC (DUF1343 family)
MSKTTRVNPDIVVGAARMDHYLPLLTNQRVGIICNQSSLVGKTLLVDTLVSLGVDVRSLFAVEHGLRGEAADGEVIDNARDAKTGIPIISLYGSNKKPTESMLASIDVLLFDLQDVGARCYTYISTLHYAMDACAMYGKKIIVLDRPNPNGFYVDGPMLDKKFQSFVGVDPLPLVHGMTVGELAQMINGEKWLESGKKCGLSVVPCDNYSHLDLYNLPIKPSPNLPNQAAVYLYPSLVLFEGTVVSIGRGTETPFQLIGHPKHAAGSIEFTPVEIPGMSKNPKHEGDVCRGHDLSSFGGFYFSTARELYLNWLIDMHASLKDQGEFFNASKFDIIAGSSELRKQIEAGMSVQEIRQSWNADLIKFKSARRAYLLYTDFE